MFVDIKLDNDFIEKISELYTKYGDKLANLNGLSAKYLNFTDFIDNFVDSKTVADV